ncbi:MAG TPA: TlpA disulfide reductase family protein [Chthoniobacterales bacterium]|nr:TlpA disulfide reductase family protein [Chthoniobacterales bacterium]
MNAEDQAAAAAWSHVEDLSVKANARVPVGDNAVEFYAGRNKALHDAAADFAHKFPNDVHEPQAMLWKLDTTDFQESNEQKLALLHRNEVDAQSLENDASLPANLRCEAEQIIIMQWLDNPDLIVTSDQASAIENRIVELLQKNPQEPRAVTFQLARAGLMLHFDHDKGIARLQELAESSDRNLAEGAAVQLTKVQIIGRPLDLQFETIDGSSVDLAGLRGKVVLIDFWASWCPDCIRETPTVRSVYQKYKDKGFAVIGISLDKDRQAMSNYIAKKLIPWPQYFDGKGWGNDFATRFGVRAIPELWLINQRGEVVATDVAADQLEAKLSQMIGG